MTVLLEGTATRLDTPLIEYGDIASFLNEQDWSQTFLGATHEWPACLKTALNILLPAPYPMFLVWGSDRQLLYNAACGNQFQAIQACSFGQSLAGSALPFWQVIAADVEQVLVTGQSLQCSYPSFSESEQTTPPIACTYSPLMEGVQVMGVFATLHPTPTTASHQPNSDLILERMTEAFIVLDRDWRITYANRETERLNNMPTSQIVGKTHWEMWPWSVGSVVERNYRRAMLEQTPAHFELLYEPLMMWLEVHAYPSEEGMGVFFRDITERKRSEAERDQAEIALRQSEQRFRVAQELSLDAFTVLKSVRDETGNVIDFEWTYANPKAAQILGYPVNQLIGRRLLATLPGNKTNSELFERYVDVVETGEPHDIELFYDSDGITGWFRNMTVKLDDGVAISFCDVTDRKRAEQEREHLLLQERIAREDAERANRIKDEFLAVLSHELRSPLNPILGWAKLLLTQKFDADRTRQGLEAIERNARLQTQLIEDLLDVSRILRGKISLNIHPVNLITVTQAAMETVRLSAEAKAIDLRLILPKVLTADTFSDQTTGLQVAGDSTRLQQIVWNLLSNAIKFTPAGGRVEVTLESGELPVLSTQNSTLTTQNLQHYAKLTVTDTGKGISPEFLPHVFDYFRQQDSTTTRQFGGLGLGLAIVRYLTELHGGMVFAASQGEGQGVTFTVQLPLLHRDRPARALDLQQASTQVDSAPLAGMRILVVDDEADMRDLAEIILQRAGAQVMLADSGLTALQKIAQFRPDLLICDIGMPNMDGYMLLQQIRQLPPEQGGEMTAIALTAYAGETDQQQALAAGFQSHMGKPIEPDLLVQAILELCSVH